MKHSWSNRLKQEYDTKKMQCPISLMNFLTMFKWFLHSPYYFVEANNLHSVSNFTDILLNPFTPRVSYGDIKVILTSGSVVEIL